MGALRQGSAGLLVGTVFLACALRASGAEGLTPGPASGAAPAPSGAEPGEWPAPAASAPEAPAPAGPARPPEKPTTNAEALRARPAPGHVEPKGKPQSVEVDLQRLGAELDLYADEANRTRLATALTGLGVGSALVPSGLVLLGRTDGVSRALVIGMIIGGSAQLASVGLVFIPTRMDEIRDDYMARPASRESKATIRAVETQWREAAEASRERRAVVGATLLSVGAVGLASGLTLLLAPAGVAGMSRKTQYTWGGVMMGVGVPLTTVSVRVLLEWSLEETSWEAYRTMKADAGTLSQDLPRPHLRPSTSVGLGPAPGGVVAFTTLAF